MALLRRYGADFPARSLRREMEQLFEDFFGTSTEGAKLTEWSPLVDIKEEDNGFKVKVDLPGMDKDDICIEVDGNRLAISGERKFEQEEKKENYHFVERSYGKFYRSFTLPAIVQADKIDATYKDGVLEVNLPKKEEVKPKKVTIK
ncbi:Hsp20/alpha crystallin family protein [bacterium]|nr:Hsp20/alpha crystallin family protein [bacterium]